MTDSPEQFVNIFQAEQKAVAVLPDQVLKPEPIADLKLTHKICTLLQSLLSQHQVRKGVNEVLKEINKSAVEVVIMAADCEPLEIIMMLPSLCEEKNIQYCFIPSKAVLGRVCGIKRPVVAAAITFKQGSQYHGQILELKDRIEQLLI